MMKIIAVFMILTMVCVGSGIFPATTYRATDAELVYGEFIDISDETDVEILSKIEILSVIEETEDKILEIDATIGEIDVSYWEHEVNGIKIKNDYILLQEDANTEEMVGYEVHWRDISNVSFEFEPSLFEPEDYSWKQKVMFLTEDDTGDFYTFYETPGYPVACWEVRYEDGATLLYDFDGNEIGWGVQAPSEKGFSLSGYCSDEHPDGWIRWRENADYWFSKWCSSTVSVSHPSSDALSSYVQDLSVVFFYELAHGNSEYFINAEGENYRATSWWGYNAKDDMAGRSPMKFAFIGSCEGMDFTGPDTFSYEFRKGQMTNTVTIGYDGMGTCDGWSVSRQWQNYMFEKMDEGSTIKHSFDLASARYPTIASCVVFVGDPDLKIVGNLDVWTDKEAYSVGENVTITLENNEDETVYFSTTSHWSIQKDVNGNWETIYPGIVPQMITQLGSGEKEENIWNQRDAGGVQVGPGGYRVKVVYSMGDWIYTFTKYAYFSIGGNVISPLFVNIDRSIYAPDENVSITAQNIGTDALSLKKWNIEKKIVDGIWETIYESSIFSDYVLLPINDTFIVAIPYNGTIVTVPPDETVIDLPNATISIWGNDTAVIGNWTTIAPLIGNQSSGISITDSISNGNITDWIIETPVINWTSGSSGWITTVTNDNVTGINNNLIIGEELTFIQGENLAYITPFTMLLPNQKLTWTWPQITFDGDAPGFGVYHVKIEYGDKHVCSESFSIAYYLQLKESYLIEGSSLNETPLIVFNLSETPSLVTDELSFPDSIYLYDGFLIDYENDETYDAFQSLVYEKRTDVKQDDNENYLIDTDGDGNWDYIYDPVAGTTTSLKEEETVTPETSWIMIVGIVVAIVIIAIIVFLYKKKNISKKD